MYIPEYHRIEDRPTSIEFMRSNPFAILISETASGTLATHIPVLIQEIDDRVVLRAHMAKANAHWKSIAADQEQDSLIIFHGPHAYISPALYENPESVPTWNYAAVHVYGRAAILEAEADVRQTLRDLISRFDASYRAQWQATSREYQARRLSHIVAFEIVASRIETKFKLSQNRTKADQRNVIQALADSPDSAISGVAKLMRQQGLGLP